MEILKKCDHEMLGFIARTLWENCTMNEKLVVCDTKRLEKKKRSQKLRWSGQLIRRDEEQMVRKEVLDIDAAG